MFRLIALAMTASVALVPPINAQTRPGTVISPPALPSASYETIEAGRLHKAEASLIRTRQRHPDAPEVTLNLAAVYLMTDRPELARSLYEEILARPAMAMDMPSGEIVSSHEVARRGSMRISTDLASR